MPRADMIAFEVPKEAGDPNRESVQQRYICKRCGWICDYERRICLPCLRITQTKWRAANPDKTRATRLRSYKKLKATKPEVLAAKYKRKVKKKPEKYREKDACRFAFLRSGDVTKPQLLSLYETANGKCKYCGVDVKCRFTPTCLIGFDHVIPKAKGGLHTISNLVVCCRRCNFLKGDRTSDEFEASKGTES
jgi:5-methylcytosine-specific restriction endonuclease McrA